MRNLITKPTILATIVVAVMAAAALTWWPEATSAQNNQRPAPTGIAVNADGPDTVNVSWTAHPDGAKDYRVSWAPEGENFRTWTNNDWNAYPTGASHTITGLESDTTYRLRLRARFDGAPSSAWSSVLTVTTEPPTTESQQSTTRTYDGNIGITLDRTNYSFRATDDVSDATSWKYVFVDTSTDCGATAFEGSAHGYTEDTDQSYTSDADLKYICIQATTTDGSGYLASDQIYGNTGITGVTVSPELDLITKRHGVTIAVQFGDAMTLNAGVRLELNTQGGTYPRAQAFTNGSDTVPFYYYPRNNEITPGMDTDSSSDDEFLKVEGLRDDSGLVDSDGFRPHVPSGVTVTGDVQVDARIREVIVVKTGGSFLGASPTITILSGVQQPYNTYKFEYYLIPTDHVIPNDLTGEPGSRQLDLNCRFNDFYGKSVPLSDRYEYVVPTLLSFPNAADAGKYLCLRARRGDLKYWSILNADFGGIASTEALDGNDAHIISIEDDTGGITNRTLTQGDTVNIRVYTSASTAHTGVSLTLNNGAAVSCTSNHTSSVDGRHYLHCPYTVQDSDDDRKTLNVTAVNIPSSLADFNANLPHRSNLAHNENISVARTQPYITEVHVLENTPTDYRHGNGSIIRIHVHVSEPVSVSSSPHSPHLEMTVTNLLAGNTVHVHDESADLVGSPSAATLLAFDYTVKDGHQADTLDIRRFHHAENITGDATGLALNTAIPNTLANHPTKGKQVAVDAVLHEIILEWLPGQAAYRAAAEPGGPWITWAAGFIEDGEDCAAMAFTGEQLGPSNQVIYSIDNDGERICYEAIKQVQQYDPETDTQTVIAVSAYQATDALDLARPTLKLNTVGNYKLILAVTPADTMLEYRTVALGTDCASLSSATYLTYNNNQQIPQAQGQHVCIKTVRRGITNYAAAEIRDSTPPEFFGKKLNPGEDRQVSTEVRDRTELYLIVDGAEELVPSNGTRYGTFLPDTRVRQIPDGTACDAALGAATFTSYTKGNAITLNIGNRACWRAEDDWGNVSFLESQLAKDLIDPVITVTGGSSSQTFKATVSDDSAVTMHYKFTSGCQRSTLFNSDRSWKNGLTSYTPGNDVSYTSANNGDAVCFGAKDDSERGNIAFQGTTYIDVDDINPRIWSISASNRDTDGNLISKFYLEQSLSIVMELTEPVKVNGAIHIPQMDNLGSLIAYAVFDKSRYEADSYTDTLHYTYVVREGEYIKGLGVQQMHLSSSTIQDRGGNHLDQTMPATLNLSYINIDGVPPTISFDDGPNTNTLAVEVDDPNPTGPNVFNPLPSWKFVFVNSGGRCDDWTDFSGAGWQHKGYVNYTSAQNGKRVCVMAQDDYGEGNTTYAKSGTLHAN